MLKRLHISNIALIDSADILFDERLNVLSGETGSGKSVILDSINFVLGSKADKSMIRHGESQAFVRAEFEVPPDSPAARAVEELDIECGGQIIITRKYSADGRGSIKLNGNGITASMLRAVTSRLVDVHGQSEHFFLLSEANQLKVIDGLCGTDGDALKTELAGLIAKKRSISERIARLGGDEQERARQLDLLEYQIKEISAAGVREGEYEELIAKRNILNNTEKILAALSGAENALNSEGGCTDLISAAQRQFSAVSEFGSDYAELCDRLENLYAEADDIARSITDLADGVSFDEQEARCVEERIELLRALMKKYGSDEREILDFLDKATAKYDDLVNSGETISKLNMQLIETNDEIFSLCARLSELRRGKAAAFGREVEDQLRSLNIPDAQFVVEFSDFDRQSAHLDSANGSDSVCFMFSANKGEPLKPLGKVISGGEMSRFMLAIKTRLKGLNGISTYIFDEIDAGISGMTARTVAQKFIEIAEQTQIIAVSHLPQVCAASNAQFLIYKTEENEKTVTHVRKLTDEQKIDELIRLTGSVDSPAAREHAKQLIAQYVK